MNISRKPNDTSVLYGYHNNATTAHTTSLTQHTLLATDSLLHLNIGTIDSSLNNIVIAASGAVCCFAAAAIYHFVDSKDSIYHHDARTRSIRYNLMASLYLLKNKVLLFMLPIPFYLGMIRAFVYYTNINLVSGVLYIKTLIKSLVI